MPGDQTTGERGFESFNIAPNTGDDQYVQEYWGDGEEREEMESREERERREEREEREEREKREEREEEMKIYQ